jgi:hypothetical protein
MIDKLPSYMLLLMVPEQVRDSLFFMLLVLLFFISVPPVCVFLLSLFFSSYLEVFLQLEGKVNAVLAFLIVSTEISQFSQELHLL